MKLLLVGSLLLASCASRPAVQDSAKHKCILRPWWVVTVTFVRLNGSLGDMTRTYAYEASDDIGQQTYTQKIRQMEDSGWRVTGWISRMEDICASWSGEHFFELPDRGTQ